jgi:DNA primase
VLGAAVPSIAVGIPDEDVAAVRAATDIVALIGEHAALKRQGRRWVGLCPFHAEKTPSFSVNAEEGFYYCFGCQAKGDAITFLRAVEHLDFVEAVRALADRAGVIVREDEHEGAASRRRKELLAVLEEAAAWYHHRLIAGPDAGPARDYLRSRGYDGDVVRRFRLGWAPDAWDLLCTGLGLRAELATGAGLGFVNRAGRLQDAFRARIMFPICDTSGRPVAFGGRVLPGSSDPAKYKNSQETAVYAKRRVLYALNWAKADIVRTGEVVVCEGYTDVIGCFESGVERAVATCGTALGEEHFRLLVNFARRIVLAFDADGAGQAAAGRFYEWEKRHEVDVVVADLPPGGDPGELARSDPDALRVALAGARPFLQFRVERILGAADLTTAEGRARAADAALVAVAEHPDDLVRDQYVMLVAERCRLEPGQLRHRLEAIRRDPSRHGQDRTVPAGRPSRDARAAREHAGDGDDWVRDPDDPGGGPAHPGGGQRRGLRPGAGDGFRPGLEALRLAVHRPDEVAHRLEPVLFPAGVQREAFLALVEADDLHDALARADEEVANLLARLVVEEPVGDPGDVVAQLVREAARRELAGITVEARRSPDAAAQAAAEAAWVRPSIEALDDPATVTEASERLVAWLMGRGQVSAWGYGA